VLYPVHGKREWVLLPAIPTFYSSMTYNGM
jgi:hypothetical protein